MIIRKAEIKDIKTILKLLSEVLEIHAKIRPDIFVSGTTKYNEDDLRKKLGNPGEFIFIAEENDEVVGFLFSIIQEVNSRNMKPHRIFYIDDLCVDKKSRGKHIGQKLFEFAKEEAKRLGCYEITLNVWEGNESAKAFYEKMGLRTKSSTLEFVL